MIITALTKFTTLDFPGKLACIIFTGGCNLRCGFCHNAEFVLPEKLQELKNNFLPFEVVKNFLESRRGLLEGVVICGGEPTVQPDLIEKIKEIREMGFAVKLDTNGTNPEILEKILEERLVDFVAMDLKDEAQYRKSLVGVTIDGRKIVRSIELIMNSGIDYEFRTTMIPGFHDEETLARMGETIRGAKTWSLQKYRNGKTLNEEFENFSAYSNEAMSDLAAKMTKYVERVEVR